MAKITLNHMFASASGKLCKKEGTYVAYNKQTGKMYQAEYHERNYPNSELQQAVKAYKAQSKIGNPYSFLRSLVTDDLKVMLGGKDLTGGIVPGQTGGGTSTDQGDNGGVLE